MRTSPGSPITAQALSAATSDETLGPWIDVSGCTSVTLYLSGSEGGTISGGVISIEECAPRDVSNPVPFGVTTGGYSVVTTYTATGISSGLQVAIHLPNAAYYFVRARVSTAISGGGSVSGVWRAH